jgi:periplasmic protein TonB
MKLKLLFLFFILSKITNGQQEKDQFFVFNENWKPVDIKKAVYLLRVRHINDSSWEWLYYNIYGPRIKMESFKDEKATIKNGNFFYYHEKGFIDSSGKYADGELDGEWFYRNEEGKITRKKTFAKGILVADTTFEITKTDTAKENKLLPGEVESEYPGGLDGWSHFLMHNLHYPDRAVNYEVQGEVRLQFIVDKEGNIISPEINRSVEYSLDEESLRIINLSEKWQPAEKDGRKVKSYKIQPINLKLSVN